MRANILLLFVFTATGVLAQGIPPRPDFVPEPKGLHAGPLHGYVPSTVRGGKVIHTDEVIRMVETSAPLLIDVAAADRKPAGMSSTTPWLPQHRSLPGAVWLQNAGDGTGDPAFGIAFEERISALTKGDRDIPIIVFCHPDCWGGYNAARRIIALGYHNVFWFPEGMEGWQDARPTSVVKADQKWVSFVPAVVPPNSQSKEEAK